MTACERRLRLCLADFIKPYTWIRKTGQFDVLPIQLVTTGNSVSELWFTKKRSTSRCEQRAAPNQPLANATPSRIRS